MLVTEQPNDAMAGRPSPSHGSSNYEHFCRISVDRAANSGAYDPKGHVVPGQCRNGTYTPRRGAVLSPGRDSAWGAPQNTHLRMSTKK